MNFVKLEYAFYIDRMKGVENINTSPSTSVEKSSILPSRTVGVIIYLLPILTVVNNIFYVDETIKNIVLTVSAVLLVLINLYAMINKKSVNKLYLVGFVGVAFGFISTVINKSGYGSIITFACLLLYLIFFSVNNISAQQKGIITNIAIVSLIIVLYVFSDQDSLSTYYFSRFPNLTEKHLNPNTIGILYFYLLVFLSKKIQDTNCRELIKRALSIVAFIIILLLSYKTKARTSLVALICFFVLNNLNIFVKRKPSPKVSKIYFWGLIGTLLFTFVYIVLYNINDGSLVFMGKDLFTGREIIWVEAYEILADHWFWGYNNKFGFMDGDMLSAHNSLLAEWFVFGIVPLICCIRCIIKGFRNVLNSKNNHATISALFACLILMTFETILSDSNLYCYFAMLFMVALEEKTNDS